MAFTEFTGDLDESGFTEFSGELDAIDTGDELARMQKRARTNTIESTAAKIGVSPLAVEEAVAAAKERTSAAAKKSPKVNQDALFGSLLDINLEDAQRKQQLESSGFVETVKGMELADIPKTMGAGALGVFGGAAELLGGEHSAKLARDRASELMQSRSDAIQNELSPTAGVSSAVLQSVPGMAAGIGVGGVVGKVLQTAIGATRLGANAAIASEIAGSVGAKAPLAARAISAIPSVGGASLGEGGVSAMSGADQAASEFDQLRKRSPDTIRSSTRYQELLEEHGGDAAAMDALRREAVNKGALYQGGATTLTGALIGALIPGIDAKLVSRMLGKDKSQDSGVVQIAKSAGGESVQEFGQSGAESIAGDLAARTFDPAKQIGENALFEASMGGIAGAVTGGGISAVTGMVDAAAQRSIERERLNALRSNVEKGAALEPAANIMQAETSDAAVETFVQQMSNPATSKEKADDLLSKAGIAIPDSSELLANVESQIATLPTDVQATDASTATVAAGAANPTEGLAVDGQTVVAGQSEQSQSLTSLAADQIAGNAVATSGSSYTGAAPAVATQPVDQRLTPVSQRTGAQSSAGVSSAYGTSITPDTGSAAAPQGLGSGGDLPVSVLLDQERATAQRKLDISRERARLAGRVEPKVTLGKPDEQSEQAVAEIASAIGLIRPGQKIVPFSDTAGTANGFVLGDSVYVNTVGLTNNIGNTTFHELKHVIERVAAADRKAGLTDSPAIKFDNDMKSLFGMMSDKGRRSYAENFLFKAELSQAGKKGEPAYEARLTELLADPELESEMTADFLGNRGTDRDFINSLAEADPVGFKAFAQKWLKVIDNLIAKLRGSGGNRESKKVDMWVGDLEQAKTLVRDAMIRYSQETNGSATYSRTGEQNEILGSSGVGSVPADAGNNRPEADRVGGSTPSYGQPREGAISVVGRHYSKSQRTTLSGLFYGQGLKGAEAQRLEGASSQIRSRIYFYTDTGKGIRPESGVGGYAHEVRLDNIYDQSSKLIPPQPNNNAFEEAVVKAGFDGYLVKDFTTTNGAVVLLGTKHGAVPVRYVQDASVASSPVSEAPSTIKKGLLSKEANAVDLNNIPGAKMRMGNLEVPADQRDAANAEMRRIGSEVMFSRSNFEVAPDPNNEELSGRWNALSLDRKLTVSRLVADSVVPRVLSVSGATGQVSEQFGSYLADTNPSFALTLESGNVHEVSKQLGYVLSQDSMMNLSMEPFDGSEEVGAVLVDLGDKSFEEVKSIYDSIRSKVPEVRGQSFTDGVMTVLNYSDTPTTELMEKIDVALSYEYHSSTQQVYASFPQKEEYGYGTQGNDTGADRQVEEVVRQRLDSLRRETSRIIEDELRFSRADDYPEGFFDEDFTDEDYNVEAFSAEDADVDSYEDVIQELTSQGYTLKKVEAPMQNFEAPTTRQFKKWFRESKWVWPNGQPKIGFHGTAQDIHAFRAKQAGAIFVAPDPDFTESYTDTSSLWMEENPEKWMEPKQFEATKKAAAKAAMGIKEYPMSTRKEMRDDIMSGNPEGEALDLLRAEVKRRLPSGPNVIPVWVSVQNPFDYENPSQIDEVLDVLFESEGVISVRPAQESRKDFTRDGMKRILRSGNWNVIESPEVQKAIRGLEFDGFFVSEYGRKNIAVYQPNQIKSVFNKGAYSLDDDRISFSRTEGFKTWSEGLPVVENGEYEGGPAVLKMYHGTTHDDITVFKNVGSKEGALGQGPYFTTSAEDASLNYAGVGPDLTSRISREEESVADGFNDDDQFATEVLEDYFASDSYKGEPIEVTDDNFEDLKDEYGEAAIKFKATSNLKGKSDGLMMPVYVKVKKPFDMRGYDGTVLSMDQEYDEEGDPVGEPAGSFIDFMEAMDEVAGWYNADIGSVKDALFSEAYDGVSAKDIFDAVSKDVIDLYDDNGEMVSAGQFMQDVVKEAGYDSIIQPANVYFGRRKGFSGITLPGMKGLDDDTLHVVPFKPTQVKSTIGNNGDYSLTNPDIRFSRSQTLDERTEVKPLLADLKVALGGKTPSQITQVMGRFDSLRRKFNRVNEATFQDELIDLGSRAVKLAVDAGVSMNDEVSVPVPMGATPHTLAMLKLDMAPLRIDSRIVGKVLNDKHAAEFANVTPTEFVSAIYKPVMVTSMQKADEYEVTTSLISEKSGLPITFVVKRNASFAGQTGENGKQMRPMNTHAIMSAYSKESMWPNGVREAIAGKKLLYVNSGMLEDLAIKNPALGRVILPKEVFDKPDASGVMAPSAASNPFPSTSSSSFVKTSERPDPSIGAAQMRLDPKKASLLKTLRQQTSASTVKGWGDLVQWVSQNYNGDADEMPMFSRTDSTEATPDKRQSQIESTINLGGVSRSATRPQRDALARIMKDGVTSPDDLRALLKTPGYSKWARSAIAGDMAGAAALRSELQEAFPGTDWKAPRLNEQGIVTFYSDWSGRSAGSIDKLTRIADKYDAPIAVRGGALSPKDPTARLLRDFDFEPYMGAQERAERMPNVMFSMIRPAGGVTATTPLFSRMSGTQGQNFAVAQERKRDHARRIWQDYFLPILRVQEAITGSGGLVSEVSDVYRAEERMYGRIEEALRDFREKEFEPLIEATKKAGLTPDELALYAYAMHAPERNAHIASINRRFPDGGSGMTDAEAAAIIAQFQTEGKEADLQKLHTDLMAITNATRLEMLDRGLITQDEYDSLQNMFENYVPLRGLDEDTTKPIKRGGGGFNIRGKETMRALGRRSRAGDILENIVTDYERAVSRGEQNLVGKVFLKLVQDNPDPGLWEIDAVKTKDAWDRQAGRVKSTSKIDTGPDTISVKVYGKEVYIKIHDEGVLRAMRKAFKSEVSGVERFLTAVFGGFNNMLRATLTQYNPVFGFVNWTRDVQMGAVGVLDELGAGASAKFLNPKLQKDAMMAASRFVRGVRGNSAIDRMFEEFRAAGATTGGFYAKDAEHIRGEIRNMMLAMGAAPKQVFGPNGFSLEGLGENVKTFGGGDGRKLMRSVRYIVGWLEHFGLMTENATRFAAYKVARDMGKTPAEAASIAKNLTTNFNRKGEWGQAMNSAYLFFNAAMQGSARVVKALQNRKVQGLMAGMVAAGAGLAALAMSMGDDDDGQAYWDKIPSHEKERNFIIMLPPGYEMEGAEKVGSNGRYIKIPMPYGFSVFPTLGYVMHDVARNAQDRTRGVTLTKGAAQMVSAVMGSFNPFGGAFDPQSPSGVMMAAAPTMADVVIQQAMGRNSFDRPTAPFKGESDTDPDSENVNPRQAGSVWHMIARGLNYATGGDEATSGKIDVAPGSIENLVKTATGGTGTFLSDVLVNLPVKMFEPNAEITQRDMPLVRNFFGMVDGVNDTSLLYERRRAINEAKSKLKNYKDLGLDPEKMDSMDFALAYMAKTSNRYSKLMSTIRKEEIDITLSDAPKGEKNLKIKQLQKERNELAAEFNKAYMDVMRGERDGEFAVDK